MLLTKPEEGRWFLEDLSGTIPLNLHGLPSPGGLVTEGSIVAVEGRGSASMFDVQVGMKCRMAACGRTIDDTAVELLK